MSISLCSRDRHPRIPRFSLFHLSALWLITSSTRVILGCCTPTAAVYFQYMPKSAVVVVIHALQYLIFQGIRPPDIAGRPVHPVEDAQSFGNNGPAVRGEDVRQRQGGPEGVLAQGPKAGLPGD